MDRTPPAQVVRLRVDTFTEQTPEPACTGSYGCPCTFHVAEREADVDRGVRPLGRQPWHARAPRSRAA